MTHANSGDPLDAYLSPAVRQWIEQRYYARINEQAQFDRLLCDADFLRTPEKHIALWPDHGVVHVRDVARQIVSVIDNVQGVLIPVRSERRLAFMKAYSVMVAYAHDIGMQDFTRHGRAMHPEFATQAVLSPIFDPVIDMIWSDNCGGVTSTLESLADRGILIQHPRDVLREMIAMANCHSKSKVPVEVLNDPAALQKAMRMAASTDLRHLYSLQRAQNARLAYERAKQTLTDFMELDRLADAVHEAEEALARSEGPDEGSDGVREGRGRSRHGSPPPASIDAPGAQFQWLLGTYKENYDLIDDVVDTLRALRGADALRQRGAVLKTSGNYELFVDQRTANAICALRRGNDELFLVELSDRICGGEANIASSELGHDGNLRISFHRGAFPSPEIVLHAAQNAAIAVNDIQTDVIESFKRPSLAPTPTSSIGSRDQALSLKPFEEIQIQLEGVDDNLEFAHLVRKQLRTMNPRAVARVRVVPSLQNATPRELQRYLGVADLDWSLAQRRDLLARIDQTGHKASAIDPDKAFEGVREVRLNAGEVLIDAGTPASFVYIPLGDGLKVIPLGGYPPFFVCAWMALGNTGVIRGAMRNATVVAERDVALLMIPKEAFLNHWHHPYSPAEFRQEIERRAAVKGQFADIQGEP